MQPMSACHSSVWSMVHGPWLGHNGRSNILTCPVHVETRACYLAADMREWMLVWSFDVSAVRLDVRCREELCHPSGEPCPSGELRMNDTGCHRTSCNLTEFWALLLQNP